MRANSALGKLHPETGRERVLRLMALTYAVSLLELRHQVCRADRAIVDRAFERATSEALRIGLSNVRRREAEFRRRYAQYLPQPWVQ